MPVRRVIAGMSKRGCRTHNTVCRGNALDDIALSDI